MWAYIRDSLVGHNGNFHLNEDTSEESPKKQPLVVYVYNGRRTLAKRKENYTEAIKLCYTLFPILHFEHVTLYTSDLSVCCGELAQICEESWSDVYDEVNTITVMIAPSDEENGFIILNVLAQDHTQITTIRVRRSTTIVNFIAGIAAHLSKGIDSIKLYKSTGVELHRRNTVDESGLRGGDNVYDGYPLRRSDLLRGKKPVIYLRSPTTIDVFVRLTLTPQWSLTAVYPVVPIRARTTTTNEEIVWRVRIHSNGDLTETSTNLDVAYLYWEAEADSTVQPSPPSTPESGKCFGEDFNPGDPSLHDTNSVVMAVANITQYLEKALKALGFHLEARTSFITFWLPSMLKYKYIAFRFIPQNSYQHAAPLEISPTPDVITRVFMIFKGVNETELSEWASAVERSKKNTNMWINEVGVDTMRASDTSLFSVLEWGGMEIPSSTA